MTDTNSRAAHLMLSLQALDDSNAALWCEDGSPVLEHVARVSGIAHLTRAELNAAGRVRDLSKVNPVLPGADGLDAAQIASEETALENVAEAERQSQIARDQDHLADVRLRRGREGIAKAITEWVHGARRNAQDVAREHIARDLQRRRDIAEGRIAPPQAQPIANSEIDRIAAGTRGGNGRPGGLAWRRGATPTPGPGEGAKPTVKRNGARHA